MHSEGTSDRDRRRQAGTIAAKYGTSPPIVVKAGSGSRDFDQIPRLSCTTLAAVGPPRPGLQPLAKAIAFQGEDGRCSALSASPSANIIVRRVASVDGDINLTLHRSRPEFCDQLPSNRNGRPRPADAVQVGKDVEHEISTHRQKSVATCRINRWCKGQSFRCARLDHLLAPEKLTTTASVASSLPLWCRTDRRADRADREHVAGAPVRSDTQPPLTLRFNQRLNTKQEGSR